MNKIKITIKPTKEEKKSIREEKKRLKLMAIQNEKKRIIIIEMGKFYLYLQAKFKPKLDASKALIVLTVESFEIEFIFLALAATNGFSKYILPYFE